MQTMLERIADAEHQADRILEEANQAARERVAEARDAAADAVEKASEAERQRTVAALADAQKEGAALAEERLSSVRTEVETVRTRAEGRISEAVAYLMERVEAAL